MVYSFVGLSKDSRDASTQFNSILSLTTRAMGKIELIAEDDATFQQLRKLVSKVSDGDTVQIYSISKLGATPADALDVLTTLVRKGVSVVSVTDGNISPNLLELFQLVIEGRQGHGRKFPKLSRLLAR